ncbi:MAG: hypothetical protein JWO00_261 [Candidatus Parcubacteria bacterium]|nr:hypothetical protein [Candidatus Parcubacteria bacterium]
MSKNLTAFILLVIAIGVYFTVTSGMIVDAKSVKAVNDQYSAALSSADRLIATRDEVLKQYNAISEADRDRLDKMIPSTVDNIRLIIDMNNVAIRHGFTLPDVKAVAASGPNKDAGSVAVRPPVSADGAPTRLTASSFAAPILDTVSVSFTATATYEQFLAFLQDLEANLRVMDVTHLTVGATDLGTYTFQVQLQTYWLRQ